MKLISDEVLDFALEGGIQKFQSESSLRMLTVKRPTNDISFFEPVIKRAMREEASQCSIQCVDGRHEEKESVS